MKTTTGFDLFYELFVDKANEYYLTKMLPVPSRYYHPLFKYWDSGLTRDHDKTDDMVLLLNEILSRDSE